MPSTIQQTHRFNSYGYPNYDPGTIVINPAYYRSLKMPLEGKDQSMEMTADPKLKKSRKRSLRPSSMAGMVIGTHSFQHMYTEGFLVIIPAIYSTLGLTPILVGLISPVRQALSGIFTIGGGILVDRFQSQRGFFLGLSLALMGLGYMLVGVAPTYTLILISLGFASAAGSFWHPIALGLLSQSFPERRGLVISLHRAGGSVGSTIAPTLVGFLLLVVTWREILQGAFPIAFVLAGIIWFFLWGIGDTFQREQSGKQRTLREHFHSLAVLINSRPLFSLLVVAGVRGMGDRALLLFLPLYLAEDLNMNLALVGVHLSLLQAMSIGFGPIWGWLSDRWGRKPVIVFVMGISTVLGTMMVFQNTGLPLTILIALMGTVMYAVNSLVQAGAMDLAEGQKLEGSLIGLLWGNNAIFGSFSPLILGVLATIFGFSVIFPYAAVLYLLGLLASLFLPGTPKSSPR